MFTLVDADSAVEISLAELGEETRLDVSVRTQTFRGEHDEVWVGLEQLRGFAAELRRLESERSGEAVLESLSPEEFRLAFRVASPAGGIAAEVRLTRHQFGSFARYPCFVGCDFALPGEDLGRLIEQLERELRLD